MTDFDFWHAEASMEDSCPVFLVHLYTLDEASHWRWTTAPEAITYGGNSFTAEPGLIVRKHSVSENTARAAKEIQVGWTNVLMQALLTDPPDSPIRIVIYKGHEGYTYVIHWQGWLQGCELKGDQVAVIQGTPWYSDLGQAGLCLRSGVPCQVPLYSDACGVDKDDYAEAGTVLTVDGTEITASVFGTQADDYFAEGLFVAASGQRRIMEHTGTSVILSHPIVGLDVDDAFTAYPGCNHLWDGDCDTRFDNQINCRCQQHRATANIWRRGLT